MADTPLTVPNLAEQSAQQNLDAASSIDELTKKLAGTNQDSFLSAPGRQQQLDTITNQLSGNLDPSTIYNAQLNNAEQYGSGGFSSDSQAWQTAVQRALGIDRENLIGSGQKAMDSFYSQMPQVNAQNQAVTPAILEQQQATAAEQALEQQRITNQSSQFDQTLANTKEQFSAQLGLSYDQLDQNQKQFVDSQAQQKVEFDLNLQQRAKEAADSLGLGYYQASISGSRGGGGGGRGGSGSGSSSTPDPFPYTRVTSSTTGGAASDQSALDDWLNSWGFGSGGLDGGVYTPPSDSYGNGGSYNDFAGELGL